MVCPHGQEGRGVEPVLAFCEQRGEDQFFAILRMSFMDGPLLSFKIRSYLSVAELNAAKITIKLQRSNASQSIDMLH